ncbi:kelch-like protein 20 [Symsagittifera roscoffensis]|uniref:kelch-like protein 20 n=1 Tax=Symsagittifera roscoffensis TaxID=84072 RepID=UPI00307BAD32
MDYDVFESEPEPVVHEADQEVGRKAFQFMNTLRKQHKFCDVTLKVGQLKIPAHKVVLSSSSRYFCAMFTGPCAESDQNIVELLDVTEGAITLLIDYIYMGRIEIKTSNVQSLLQAASMFQLQDVVNACCKFLADQLHPSNCLGINEFADIHTCDELKSSSNNFIEENYTAVSQEEEFCHLSYQRLECLLSSENIQVCSEVEVYNSLMRWVKYDLENRKGLLPLLLNKVKLAMLDVTFLVDVVERDELISKEAQCWQLVNRAKNYHLLPQRVLPTNNSSVTATPTLGGGSPPNGSSTISNVSTNNPPGSTNPNPSLLLTGQTHSPIPTVINNSVNLLGGSSSHPMGAIWSSNDLYQFQPRKSTLGQIFYIGGMDSSGSLKTVEKLDAGSGSIVIPMASMNVARSGIGVAVLNGLIYAVGGHDGTSYLNSVECYDPSVKKWSIVANMNCPRRYVAVCAYNGLLYVAGGYSGITVLNSVEVYDPDSNCWRYVSPMNCRRRHVSMALLNKRLYAVGGHDGISYLKSVEEYDPSTDTWKFVKTMYTRRGGAGVAALGGKLYAIGGYDGNSNHSTMERYHPEEDRWSLVAPMSSCRSGLGVAVIQDKIYAIGGHDGVHYLNIVEVFDPKVGEWHIKCHMMTSRAVAGVAVLFNSIQQQLQQNNQQQQLQSASKFF